MIMWEKLLSFAKIAVGSSMWIPFSSGTTIGSKRIDLISDGSLGPVSATSVRLTVTSAYTGDFKSHRELRAEFAAKCGGR